jgi:Skp family chaperone for outer membrane proteins
MNVTRIITQAQRLVSRRGESLLNKAVRDLDKLAEGLDKADTALAREIAMENDDITRTREELAIREARAQQALSKLDANRQRSRRIYDRVAGFTA